MDCGGKVLLAVSCLLAHQSAQAMEYEGFEKYGLAWNASSVGFGAEVMLPAPEARWLPENAQVRIGANAFGYTLSTVKNKVDYDIHFRLLNAHLFLDWYPWENGLRLTMGLFYNKNGTEIEARASAGGYTLNGNNYAVNVGTVDGDIRVNPVAPYIGVGLDHKLSRDGLWSLSLDLGAMYHGKPEATLDGKCASGVAALTCTAFQQDVKAEERNLNRDLEKLVWYPVLTVGTVYRF